MRSVVVASLLLILLAGLAGCLGGGDGPTSETQHPAEGDPRPPAHPDPLAPGAHTYQAHDYDAGTTPVGGAGADHDDYAYDSSIRGTLWIPDGDGPFPLAVFLHGQHFTCHTAGIKHLITPDACEGDTVFEPYPNHMGYEYLGEHLASHGIAVASILAKEINNQNGNPDVGMWARGELTLKTIDALTDGRVPQTEGRLDTDRVALMGHSRGGEGVVTAVAVNGHRDEADRYDLKGIIALAPTDFNAYAVKNVPLLSIVPYCDGDVMSLHGLRTWDHSRFVDDPGQETAKIQLLAMGANHNFYNTMWATEPLPHIYQGDDLGMAAHMNRECLLPEALGGGRIGAEDVKNHALVHIGGFIRWTLLDDATHAAFFDGSTPMPADACPGQDAPCPERVLPSALLAHRTLIWNTTGDTFEAGPGGTGDFHTEGFQDIHHCTQYDCGQYVHSSAGAVRLQWDRPATVQIGLEPGTLTGQDVLALRVGLPVDTDTYEAETTTDFTITLLQGDGNKSSVSAAAHTNALTHPPGKEAGTEALVVGVPKVALNMIRIPLDAFEGAHLPTVSAIQLHFERTETGTLLLAEGWTQQETTLPTKRDTS